MYTVSCNSSFYEYHSNILPHLVNPDMPSVSLNVCWFWYNEFDVEVIDGEIVREPHAHQYPQFNAIQHIHYICKHSFGVEQRLQFCKLFSILRTAISNSSTSFVFSSEYESNHGYANIAIYNEIYLIYRMSQGGNCG